MIIVKGYCKMTRYKRVLNLRVDNSDQMIEIVQALSELNADIAADSTPSSVKITIHGTKGKVREVSKKIMAIAKHSQNLHK